jgi:hypothetical protein
MNLSAMESALVVLVILLIMLAGSIVCLFVIPPFLSKIEPSGRVNFFGIPFLGGAAPPPGNPGRKPMSTAVRRDPPPRPDRR